MEEKREKSGRKKLHQILAVSLLTLFLISGICTEWIQTDTFISCVENMVSFSRTEDVLSIAEPKQSLLGDVCTVEQSVSRFVNVSAKKDHVQRNGQRFLWNISYIEAVPASGIRLHSGMECVHFVQTHSQQVILSYMQRQDGKKDLFV